MTELQAVWGWQPALYLFLGGMGAGAFVTAAVLHFLDRGNTRRTVAASAWGATILLMAGLLCLITELTNPLRGMMMWQSFTNFTSWMAFGAWIVFAAVVVFGLAAVCATDATAALVQKVWKGFGAVRGRLLSALCVLGLFCGFCVAAYTGILLMSAPGVPLWNTSLLPLLFTVSAFDTGIAFVEVVMAALAGREHASRRTHKAMNVCVVALVVAELAVLGLFLGGMLAGGAAGGAEALTGSLSAHMLVFGDLALWFWGGVVLVGLVLPLAMAIVGLARETKRGNAAMNPVEDEAAAGEVQVARGGQPARCDGNRLAVTGAIGAMIGGCVLRFLVVMAGVHGDLVAQGVDQIFEQMIARLS